MAGRAGDFGQAAKAGPENVFDSVLRYGIKAFLSGIITSGPCV